MHLNNMIKCRVLKSILSDVAHWLHSHQNNILMKHNIQRNKLTTVTTQMSG